MSENYVWVKFHSRADLTCLYYLGKAEKIIQEFCPEKKIFDINQIIELFNIKKFFDHDIRLNEWTDIVFADYKETTKEFDKIIGIYFSNIKDEKLLEIIEGLHWEYIDDFWFLINRFKTYKNISESIFAEVIEQPGFCFRYLLEQKNIVYNYGQVITKQMMKSCNLAELVISQFLEEKSESNNRLVFPKELTYELKEKLILDYVRSEDTNPNYLALIEKSQDTSDLTLDNKVRLEARKKHEAYMKTRLSGGNGFKYGVQVVFSKIQEEIILYDFGEKNIIDISYSSKWIEENQDYPTLLNNFIYIFGYVDIFFRSRFISQPAKLDVFERYMGVKGIKDYETGIYYNLNHKLFNSQMTVYYQVLSNFNIELEDVFKWFFESYLLDEFQAEGFIFQTPSSGTSELERCKLLATEIDSVLKQFSLFVEEGSIDRELFEMTSEHTVLANIPSFLQEKYIYPNNNICKNCMNLLFSDQSIIFHTKKTKNYHRNFYSLIKNEIMCLDDFEEYQKPGIEWLSEQGCVNFGEAGLITLNIEKTTILKDMYYNQVTCLRYVTPYESVIKGMLNASEIYYEASLFSKPEQSYINYILNKAEFCNGPDLRNKYIHGNHSLLEEDHKRDYVELLKIMVLIIIKINEEFCLFSDKQVKD